MLSGKKMVKETREEKLKVFNQLNYPVILRQKKDKFYLIIPELSLAAVSNDLEQAYKDLLAQKERYFENIIDCEAEDEINLPRHAHHAKDARYQLKFFVLKLMIVCFLGGLTLLFGGVVIRDKIANISAADIVRRVSKDVYEQIIQFNNVSEEVRQLRINKLRRFLEELKPVVEEVKDVFSEGEGESRDKK